jgi:hypothetical protein
MNTPIKSAPRPQPQNEPRLTTPSTSDSRPDNRLGTMRRGDMDRLRSNWNQPSPNDALNADGLFFSQLLVPQVDARPDQSGYGGSGLSLLPPGDGVPTHLIDELAQRLPAQPDGPFNVTLLMPNLGRVQVNASKRDNQWNIELGFARRGVLKRLQPHHRACESALADALGQDVQLSLHEESNA